MTEQEIEALQKQIDQLTPEDILAAIVELAPLPTPPETGQ
ncbi:hypothetical protein UFOVP319_15 [uncultured Caudovirales phage]|uniref:Uncharacterized protein n=1 Tax=uncultured Caudovirales phage TaxID=2100421 RepID=A0A6J5LS78_9CAUD|nr:hypothetical protein UFOVP319_15 [uncultured Caudovirales phage]